LLVDEILTIYPLINFHYIELFIYFNDFLNDEKLNLETFVVANLNLFSPYKDSNKSNSESQEKKEKRILKKIFEIFKNKENSESEEISKISILKYCICLGNQNKEISEIYNFIDKSGKDKIESDEMKLYLNSILDFYFSEERRINVLFAPKKSNKNMFDSEYDYQTQEKIDNIINDFLQKLFYKKSKQAISRKIFIKIISQDSKLEEDLKNIFVKTEEYIFSNVFNFHFQRENNNLEFHNQSDEGIS